MLQPKLQVVFGASVVTDCLQAESYYTIKNCHQHKNRGRHGTAKKRQNHGINET